jgi:hypothetical protein
VNPVAHQVQKSAGMRHNQQVEAREQAMVLNCECQYGSNRTGGAKQRRVEGMKKNGREPK